MRKNKKKDRKKLNCDKCKRKIKTTLDPMRQNQIIKKSKNRVEKFTAKYYYNKKS